MKDVNLNPGGLLGGISVTGIMFARIGSGAQTDMDGAVARAFMFAIVAGALGGNFLWALVFGKPKDDAGEAEPPRKTMAGSRMRRPQPKRGTAEAKPSPPPRPKQLGTKEEPFDLD